MRRSANGFTLKINQHSTGRCQTHEVFDVFIWLFSRIILDTKQCYRILVISFMLHVCNLIWVLRFRFNESGLIFPLEHGRWSSSGSEWDCVARWRLFAGWSNDASFLFAILSTYHDKVIYSTIKMTPTEATKTWKSVRC